MKWVRVLCCLNNWKLGSHACVNAWLIIINVRTVSSSEAQAMMDSSCGCHWMEVMGPVQRVCEDGMGMGPLCFYHAIHMAN